MKVLLDIKDAKAPYLMEILNSLSFVKTLPLTSYQAKTLQGLKEAVEEMSLIKIGKMKGRNAEDLFNEL